MATAAPLQFHPSMALMSNASAGSAAGGGPPPVFTSGQQQQEAAAAHQQSLLYMRSAMVAAGSVRTAQGQGGQAGQQGQQGMPHQLVNQIPTGSLAVSEVHDIVHNACVVRVRKHDTWCMFSKSVTYVLRL